MVLQFEEPKPPNGSTCRAGDDIFVEVSPMVDFLIDLVLAHFARWVWRQ